MAVDKGPVASFCPFPCWAKAQEAVQGAVGPWESPGPTSQVATFGWGLLRGCWGGQAFSLRRKPFTEGLAAFEKGMAQPLLCFLSWIRIRNSRSGRDPETAGEGSGGGRWGEKQAPGCLGQVGALP